MRLAVAIASLGGTGRLRPAPGTWGSLAALPLWLGGPTTAFTAAVGFTLLGAWAIPRALAGDAEADPGWVVIDEAAGQALALAALPATGGWLGLALAFGLFRAFDILKPGPVGWADRQPGAFGVLADDLLAGAIAGAILLGLRAGGVAL